MKVQIPIDFNDFASIPIYPYRRCHSDWRKEVRAIKDPGVIYAMGVGELPEWGTLPCEIQTTFIMGETINEPIGDKKGERANGSPIVLEKNYLQNRLAERLNVIANGTRINPPSGTYNKLCERWSRSGYPFSKEFIENHVWWTALAAPADINVYRVKSWLLMVEAALTGRYIANFGVPPLFVLNYLGDGERVDPNSFSQQYLRYRKEHDIVEQFGV